ncbi:YbaK/EbsC family protein [Vibrio sp. JC009]|uniref:aminoacyl-tRNA deacylase n=1 Tax=Vibrio sp. JC009 TaxID=2912314 RepID=UPI0023AFA71D|nr:YbaK/EbsC family protein [Vibrio sp. JC009]WED22234.1 YbaK/EbsC family protein [Vibrio sp. JC009]
MTDTPFNTRITDYLEGQKIPYQILRHQTPAVTIEDAARQRGISPRQMVKSILLRDMDNNYALACVPGDLQADPKKVRQILQCRRMTCVSLSEVPEITGYQPGTVAPIMLPTPMPVFFDNSFKSIPEITISSGSNMAGLALKTEHLVSLCNPTFADITR